VCAYFPGSGLASAELVEVVVGRDVAVRIQLLVGAEGALLEVVELLRVRVLRSDIFVSTKQAQPVGCHGRGGDAGRRNELAPPEETTPSASLRTHEYQRVS
jgi:hypothetical protein